RPTSAQSPVFEIVEQNCDKLWSQNLQPPPLNHNLDMSIVFEHPSNDGIKTKTKTIDDCQELMELSDEDSSSSSSSSFFNLSSDYLDLEATDRSPLPNKKTDLVHYRRHISQTNFIVIMYIQME